MSADDVRDLLVSGGRLTAVDVDRIRDSARRTRDVRDVLGTALARLEAARTGAAVLDVPTPSGPQAAARLAMLGHLSHATLVALTGAGDAVRATLEAARGHLEHACGGLTDLARSVDHAAGIYDDVDASVWSRITRGVGATIDASTFPGTQVPFALARGAARTGLGALGGDGWRWKYVTDATAQEQEAMAGGLSQVIAHGPGLLGPLDDGSRDADVPGAADDLGRLLSVYRARFEELPVVTEVDATGVDLGSPRTMREALENLDVLYDHDSDALPTGSVGVQRILGDDGATRWLVTVPGTQLGPGTAFGAVQDVQAMASDAAVRERTDTVQVVLESMRRAGVGADEDVMIVGHSLGGMAATVVAGAATGFRVRQVVTAGSPVALYPVPSDVRATHVEVTGEVVSALDGAPNPAVENRVTVAGRIDPAAMGDDALAHSMRYQLDVLDAATAEGSPALGANLAAAQDFLDGEVVETRVFEGHLVEREPAPTPPGGTSELRPFGPQTLGPPTFGLPPVGTPAGGAVSGGPSSTAPGARP
ncbi:PGAP1-like protein [Sediminihabitans luteus]|uniref:PGAP1-like protein n=1 Tax=Sediminihabitans luteus TaxID=1138585 RepID=A0A2M9D0Q9_9CELL|nr:hypothetical protein [Sediminihabitans luteus]PJJ77740.1 PGAP1-like protein [Sediminihabitans luteus]GIJ00033.1 hypothetical protein Slu03_24100 [Sediminihabitans luteus]